MAEPLNLLNMTVQELLDLFKTKYFDQFNETLRIGSQEFQIASVFAYCLSVLQNAANDKFSQRYIDTATGEYLDALAANYGLTRPDGAYATTYVRITLNVPTHLPVDIVFPAGAVKVSDSGGQYVFENAWDFRMTSKQESTVFRCVEKGSQFNGIPVGTLNTLASTTQGIQAIENLTITGGGEDAMSDDDVFRAWLKNEIAAQAGAGTALAYYGRAMNADSRIQDVLVLEQGMDGYEKGKAKLYVLFPNTVVDAPAITDIVRHAVDDRAFRPIGDTVEVYVSIRYVVSLGKTFSVVYPERFKSLAVNRNMRILNEYNDYLSQKIGRPFIYAELAERLKATDSDGVYAVDAVPVGFVTMLDADPVYPAVGQVLHVEGLTFVNKFLEGDA